MATGIAIGIFATLIVVVFVNQWKRWDAESDEIAKKRALIAAGQEESDRRNARE